MGGGVTKDVVYAVPVSEPKAGETAIYRAPARKTALVTGPTTGARTAQAIFLKNFKEVPEREYLGYRPVIEYVEDPKTKKKVPKLENFYKFYTNAQVEEKIKQIGSGIRNLGLHAHKEQFRNYKIDFIGVHSKNNLEWILLDIANSCYGMTTMPIYDTLGEDAVDHMIEETELSTMFTTCDLIKKHVARMKAGKAKSLQTLVIMDEALLSPEDVKQLESVKWYKFSEVVEAGKKNILPYPEIDPDSIVYFSYTSGTTGAPKGAMVSNKNVVAMIGGAELLLSYLNKNTVYLSYLPLAHVLEKIVFYQVTFLTGKYAMFGGDVQKLKDDLEILKPTIFVSVPRLFNKFHDVIKAKMNDLSGCSSVIAKKAVNAKMANVESGKYTHAIYDKLVFNKTKGVLGGKVEIMLSGSAPLALPVKKYLKCSFSVPFVEGYGQTEALGGQFITDPAEKRMDIVGGPNPANEFKLIDVPEMKYFSTDKDEQGRPQPRGEICVRGANVIPGYYKNEEKTKESIDADGWLHSGDIGMIVPGSNGLKIFDRRKNIFKLSHGEYVAPDRLEQIFKSTRGVADIFVYGDSLKSNLVGILNIDPKESLKFAESKGIHAQTVEELAKSEPFNKAMLEALKQTGEQNGLKGFERIVKLYIDTKPFADSDLVTTTFKLKRNEAKTYYKQNIDKLYEGLD